MCAEVTIFSDHPRWEEKELLRASKELGVKAELLNIARVALDCARTLFELSYIRCISHTKSQLLAWLLSEHSEIVVNSRHTYTICSNKAITTAMLSASGIPTPRTVVCFDRALALEKAEELGFPVVIKPVYGSWGTMVGKLSDRDSLKAVLEHKWALGSPQDQVIYLQEFVKRPPRDLRAVVVGEKVVACSARYSPPGEWRTNVALGGKSERHKLTQEEEELFLKAARVVGGGVLGIDAMESERGLLIHEINPGVEFKGVVEATRVDVAREIVSYLYSLIKK